MSRQRIPSLVVEWSPGKVVALGRNISQPQTGATIAEAIQGLDKSSTLLVLSRSICFLRGATLPDATYSELEKIVRNTIGREFPLPAGQTAIDFYQSDKKGPSGRKVVVFGVSAQHLEACRAEAHSAGATIIATQPSAFGTQLVARSERVDDGVFLSMCGDGIAIDIVKDGLMHYSRVVKEGSVLEVEITRTLAAGEIGEQASSFPLYATSTEGPLASFTQCALSPLAAMLREDVLHSRLNIELLQEKESRERAAKTNGIRNASFALVGALILMAYVANSKITERKAVSDSISQIQKETTDLKTHESKITSQEADLTNPYTVIQRGFDPAQRASDILLSVSDDVPEGLWITSITFQRGQALSVRGTAKTSAQVNTFIQQLSANQRFRNVQLSFANNATTGQTTVVQFSLTAFPVGNLPLVDKTTSGANQ